jgi:hypothetical protein
LTGPTAPHASSIGIPGFPLGILDRWSSRAWALIGLLFAASALVVRILVAGPGLMAPCHDLPAGEPGQRCSEVDPSRPPEGVVKAAFLIQEGLLAVGIMVGTWGVWRLKLGAAVVGIWITYIAFLPSPVYAAVSGWSSSAAEDLSDFEPIWGYLALAPWAWALRGRFQRATRSLMVGLLALLVVGGVAAIWVSVSSYRDLGWNGFALAFGAVQLVTALCMWRAFEVEPEGALAPDLDRRARPLIETEP